MDFIVNQNSELKESILFLFKGASKECLRSTPPCSVDQRIRFMSPETITAMSLTNGSVLITWTDSNMGWKTSKRRVKVIDENAKTLMTALSRNNQNELLVTDLKADQTYELIFAPEGPNIPDFIQEFSTILALRK